MNENHISGCIIALYSFKKNKRKIDQVNSVALSNLAKKFKGFDQVKKQSPRGILSEKEFLQISQFSQESTYARCLELY